MKKVALLIAALTVGAGANAATPISFNFGSAPGNIGPTHIYTDVGGSGLQIIASGFDASNTATNLYGKNDGGDEVGVGLANDPSGQHEIHYGSGYVQLDVQDLLGKVTDVQFGTNSTTQLEQWSVFGSNSAHSYAGGALLSGTSEGLHNLPSFGTYRYYDFVSTSISGGQNFLVASLSGIAAVPEPASWAMMLIGLGVIGTSMRRRKTDLAFS